jgi:hypothetical protein
MPVLNWNNISFILLQNINKLIKIKQTLVAVISANLREALIEP